jgi:hypothetical protein
MLNCSEPLRTPGGQDMFFEQVSQVTLAAVFQEFNM